ncbi:hypothetical protein CNYM01_13914 [Colletotrichum nymphaeae SA-01]|uniref:Uncharacterized protein n=1 Tax=Colletotrichum nymphaeae SA-01 TaxID=1460502 RepID=A0A135UTK4_9PEZI|nr:hypothetical protein CNYM01_13914 [Colletotrichum nymphaeae SA-01]
MSHLYIHCVSKSFSSRAHTTAILPSIALHILRTFPIPWSSNVMQARGSGSRRLASLRPSCIPRCHGALRLLAAARTRPR